MRSTVLSICLVCVMAVPAQADETGSQWQIRETTSRLDDSPTVSLTVAAENPIRTKYGQTVTPTLNVRCLENKTGVIADFGTYLSTGGVDDEHPVRYRIDDKKPVSAYWSVSTDFEAVGVFSNAVRLARELTEARRFILETTPYGSSPVLVEFDISGLRNRLPPLAAACGWKLESTAAQAAPGSPRDADRKPQQDGEAAKPRLRSAPTLSFAELSAKVTQAITPCWNLDPALVSRQSQAIEFRIIVTDQGSVARAEVVDKSRMARDSAFRTFAESAQRALMNGRCRPLPPEVPSGDIVVSLDPKSLF